MLKSFPRPNDLIEFLSDKQIEAGPLTAVVEETDGGDVHLRVAGQSIWLDWNAMEIDHPRAANKPMQLLNLPVSCLRLTPGIPRLAFCTSRARAHRPAQPNYTQADVRHMNKLPSDGGRNLLRIKLSCLP